MKSNFSFLKERFGEYYKLAIEAERNMFAAPRTSVMYARLTLEELVKWMYTYDPLLSQNPPEKQTLEGLMYHYPFKELIAPVPNMIDGLTAIRKNGNQAIHNKNEVALRYAHNSVNNLFEFAKWIYYTYVDSSEKLPMSLDSSLIPRATGAEESIASAKATQAQLETIKLETEKALQQKEDELERLRNEIARIKTENEQKPVEAFTLNPVTEAETRRILIDVMLRETGWNLNHANDTEYKVSGMPNKTGVGYVDYVLWGDDGLPLAVVEAKNTLHDPRKGQHQAKLYADCLENRFGRRPVIFYTNGYDTWMWDDKLYPPRRVSGFYSKDELEWAITKRARKVLAEATVDKGIAGRYYQEEALKRVAETFDKKHRKALLVMATGTGKTRTAIAFVEMAMRQGWARRILFLADRNALVIQAKNNFVKLLPNLSCADITKEKENLDMHRMVFSTYPTIANKIDSEKINDLLVYSPGHFDLIIIDEAHRSIYRKYQMIFQYFDALLLGLTATPKSDIDKNTYEFFDLENHNPTYSYELDKAVADKFLVPPKKVVVTTRFLQQGIKYNELSEEEKREYEEKFFDDATHSMPEEIDSSELNRFVFNAHTVDLVLNQLMTDGLKIEGGDKVGKSVIFAKNHQHALFIQERFYKLYPHLGGDFIQVIDNYQTYAQSMIDDFSDPKKQPQIAISVDMLDTGIDVPEILNLVFFKVVKSSVKFWQMIGRGTRLCPGIFGIPENEEDTSKDKSEFLIFDYCGNFEFFDVNPDGFDTKIPKSVAQRIMEDRLKIVIEFDKNPEIVDEKNAVLRESLLDSLHNTVRRLNKNSFVVKAVLREVDEFSCRERWNSISYEDIAEILNKLVPLAEPDDSSEEARRFDLLILEFMLGLLIGTTSVSLYTMHVKSIAKELLKKTNLPIVKQKESLLKEIASEVFWKESFSLSSLEKIRLEIRDLVRLLDKEKRKAVYANFTDEIISSTTSTAMSTYTTSENYKQRVERYVRENENHQIIRKLKQNIPITPSELNELENILFDGEERGTKEEFVQMYGEQPLGKFIRSIVGLDMNAAKEAFAEFLSAGNLSADQIRFVDMIIDYLSKKGVVDAGMLFEEPFTTFHMEGVAGVFDAESITDLLSVLRRIEANAAA
ncbi:type I restriction enzyme R subunit [Parabacteroides sp. PFB2-12]|uniref:DEAD/DEAH box helicase family protein n=1 Tax=unclassified Parabacteroides TaxID=2649774 RepID=UPI0024758AC5|nr:MULTISPECIES: DEAD/DEAH box helicase family protein [unclassified Parabacteroides]MDH6343798.1 type I restriction enzyme R subunit [Parabacteroides sp. PM6-13]MDH6391960.1 type I restriction enzyme R subunit [Parabacteroides sp. PFB2-12]